MCSSDLATIPGMFAPVATPAALVAQIGNDVAKVLNRPELKSRFSNVGVDAVTTAPEEFAATLRAEIARMGKMIRAAGLKDE